MVAQIAKLCVDTGNALVILEKVMHWRKESRSETQSCLCLATSSTGGRSAVCMAALRLASEGSKWRPKELVPCLVTFRTGNICSGPSKIAFDRSEVWSGSTDYVMCAACCLNLPCDAMVICGLSAAAFEKALPVSSTAADS